jgi:hypothetical protein
MARTGPSRGRCRFLSDAVQREGRRATHSIPVPPFFSGAWDPESHCSVDLIAALSRRAASPGINDASGVSARCVFERSASAGLSLLCRHQKQPSMRQVGVLLRCGSGSLQRGGSPVETGVPHAKEESGAVGPHYAAPSAAPSGAAAGRTGTGTSVALASKTSIGYQ